MNWLVWLGVILIIILLGVLIYSLCEYSYKADEAMGAQEWQIPEEERQKGYK